MAKIAVDVDRHRRDRRSDVFNRGRPTGGVDVQVHGRGRPGRVDEERIATEAVGILADRGFPRGEVRHIQRIEESENAAGTVRHVVVVIDGQTGGIGRRSADANRIVLAGSRAVAAGVVKDVVPECTRARGLLAVEGKCGRAAADCRAAEVDAVGVEVVGA